MEMDPKLTELSQTLELFKEAQIQKDHGTSDRLLSQLEELLIGFRRLPPLSEQIPNAAQRPIVARHGHCASVIGSRGNEDYSCFSGGMTDDEAASVEDNEDGELIYATGSLTKLQHRNVKCKVRWKNAMEMAEVVEQRGRMHISMGISRGGKIYCSVEEILLLAELGALILLDDNDASLPLRYIYKKVLDGKSGCSWEAFEVYRHLKSLGFIVGRHGVPWCLKGIKGCSASLDCCTENGERVGDVCKENSILVHLKNLQMVDLTPVFDVYLPNGKFRKSSPGDPVSHIYLTGANPPSISTIQAMERRSNGVPMRFGHVDHGRVSFFTFNKVELPVLP
ncbi:hypothetical protein Dimus_002029 [Dionaea muscipula]